MAFIRAARFGRIVKDTLHYTRCITKHGTTGRPLPKEIRHPIMTEWAGKMLDAMRIRRHSIGHAIEDRPVMLVGNHVSYIDIPLLMALTPVVFIAKKQLQGWPVFGPAAASVGTIFVERDSGKSRANAGKAIAPMVHEHRQSLAIFPSGTTTMDEAKVWRHGPFRIAQEAGIAVQPFRIRYTPLRRAAYLLEDSFVGHLWKVLGSDGLDATVEFGVPFDVTDPEKDALRTWAWSREGL